jgi:fatty-acyl-CoA synthase
MLITDLLDRSALLYPKDAAVVVVEGPAVTYSELAERTRCVAAGLARRGVSRGDRVVLMADNGLVYFDVYLAVAHLGAAAVPINTHLTDPEVSYITGDAEPVIGIADANHSHRLRRSMGNSDVIDTSTEEWDDLFRADPSQGSSADEADTTLIIYTSGTTGRPKGVCLTQRGLAFNGLTMAIAQEFRHPDVFMTCTPLYHAATGTRIASMLVDGQTHVVLPRFEVETCLRAIETHGVTIVVWVPIQLRRVVDCPQRNDFDLSSLRLIVYGAAPTELPLIERAHRELAAGLYQGYGLTEAVTNLTAFTPGDHDHAIAHEPELLASCGRPVPGVEIVIRSEAGEDLPLGEVGEICVRSEKVMAGYWKRPEATAEAVVDGWLHTGDLGRMDDRGYVFIVGRAKDMLISGGVNVYPSEIEAVLHEHPAVGEAAVVGVRDDTWGEAPVAFVVPAPGAHLVVDDLHEHCAAHLARVKVPREIHVVADLPRTATGKVRKVELRAGPADS